MALVAAIANVFILQRVREDAALIAADRASKSTASTEQGAKQLQVLRADVAKEIEGSEEGASRVTAMEPFPPAQARIVPLELLSLPEEPLEPEPFVSESQVAAVEARLRDWALAWSEQRVEDYLAFYNSSFRPAGGKSRSQWARSRRQALLAPTFIRVDLSSLRVRVLDADRAGVELVQAYRSNTHHDVLTKMLELAREGDGWKIVAETVISTGAAHEIPMVELPSKR